MSLVYFLKIYFSMEASFIFAQYLTKKISEIKEKITVLISSSPSSERLEFNHA